MAVVLNYYVIIQKVPRRGRFRALLICRNLMQKELLKFSVSTRYSNAFLCYYLEM